VRADLLNKPDVAEPPRIIEELSQRLAASLEERYKTCLKVGFPYKDCRKLHRQNPSLTDRFIPDLDMYFSFIAGYTSSATSLAARPREEIRKAIPRLRLSFFETHPEYGPLQPFLTPQDCGTLYAKLHAADEMRHDLLTIMESLVMKEIL
jgi:hypothetical protein